jgi:hypothetical protein
MRTPGQRHTPCPGRGGEEVILLCVGAPRSFCLAPDRGRDLPIADYGELPMLDADFDLVGTYGDDGCDWKPRKEQARVPLAGSR